MEKVSKIKNERIEEIIKRITILNYNLKKLREKNYKKDKNKDESINNNNNNNNLGFNMDSKKYIPLTKLRFSFLYTFVIFVIIIISVVLILFITLNMVQDTNKLLLVQKYIFGKLVHTSISTIEVKCFMSYCLNVSTIPFHLLDDPNLITEVIKGASKFPKINDYYNNKFLLNTCGAIYENKEDKKYIECMNDPLIKSSNNTDNLLMLIDDWVDNIHKENDMNGDDKRNLFNTSSFKNIEYIFFKYIFNVSDYFQLIVREDLNDYLHYKTNELYTIGILMGFLTIIFCIVFGVIFIKELVHHLSVSRIILKIIPTSVIISTQELETWIENKY